MMIRSIPKTAASFCLMLSVLSLQSQEIRDKVTISRVSGPFEVKLTQQEDKTDPGIGRVILDKKFHGELEASSHGVMLFPTATPKDTGGYVAMEIVSGTLAGHTGTFALQHSGTMNAGTYSLSVLVVPGSGTNQLAGLTGKMNINIAAGGKHSYDFEYALPAR
jgi:hypothetical protein